MYGKSHPRSYGRSRLEKDRSAEYDDYGDRRDGSHSYSYRHSDHGQSHNISHHQQQQHHHQPHHQPQHHHHQQPQQHHHHHSGAYLREQYASRENGSSEERYYPDDKYGHGVRYRETEDRHRKKDEEEDEENDYHSPHPTAKRPLNAI